MIKKLDQYQNGSTVVSNIADKLDEVIDVLNQQEEKHLSFCKCEECRPDVHKIFNQQGEGEFTEAKLKELTKGMFNCEKCGKRGSLFNGLCEKCYPPEQEDISKKYYELIMAVGNKYPGETRHQTALRYIRQAEHGNDQPAKENNDTI